MKKIREIFKKNVKLVIGIIIGGVVFGTLAVYAETIIAANQVSYDNSSSGVSATNVQGAVDELYTRADKWLNTNDMGKPQYYAFGEYKGYCTGTDTSCGSLAAFPTTSTTQPLGKSVYLGLYEDGQYGVCIQKNGKEQCFRARNYKAELKHIQEVFSDIICEVHTDAVYCIGSDFGCSVHSDGSVYCGDSVTYDSCTLIYNGSVSCGGVWHF